MCYSNTETTSNTSMMSYISANDLKIGTVFVCAVPVKYKLGAKIDSIYAAMQLGNDRQLYKYMCVLAPTSPWPSESGSAILTSAP